MPPYRDIAEYITSLRSFEHLRDQIVFHKVIDEKSGNYASYRKLLSPAVQRLLQHSGIPKLYKHQARAIEHIKEKKHVVIATPTASGKTLVYNVPVFEQIQSDPQATALFLFPLKALAQDQLKTFTKWADLIPTFKATAQIYDGDTSSYRRQKIRQNPPNVIMTNPEMLHLSMLPFHTTWAEFFKHLGIVVIDEVHTYRGIMGSHMAQVFRRFNRICRFYGRSPIYILSSATISNPKFLAEQLTGKSMTLIDKSSAPKGKQHIIFINPHDGSVQTTILMLKAALHRQLRTIVYTQSRKLTELLAIWADTRSGRFADKISAYRAGFLPEERRKIEEMLSSGKLLAVISTSALELGIDIGDLDLCILVGYPGTIMATWQRSGRVGRSGQDSALVLVAGEDALDQYFMRHPQQFVEMEPEAAVINPDNPQLLVKHLQCAAAELPIHDDDILFEQSSVRLCVNDLYEQGQLLKSAQGDVYYSIFKSPHRLVDLRGSGQRYNIVLKETGQNKGEIDGFRAFRETHPGAVYLHNSRTYIVDDIDIGSQIISVVDAKVDYYTRVRAEKSTEILELYQQKRLWSSSIYTGRLRVTDQVTGYDKWRIYTKTRMNTMVLDLPPQVFETDGLWFTIPQEIQDETIDRYLHFMGGIHAIEHAAIGIMPLLILTDRNDLGGISIPFHPQLNSAAIFIYDAMPGGAGLSRHAFGKAHLLIEHTLKTIQSCPCENGCPSCVHSPKCGSGNRPIDKTCAVFILEKMKNPISNNPSAVIEFPKTVRSDANRKQTTKFYGNFGVFDLETQKSFTEVGGWHKAKYMGVSCIVLYDSVNDTYLEYLEDTVEDFVRQIQRYDFIVGFNVTGFDFKVLSGYSNYDFTQLNTLDILDKIKERLGYRLSLNHLAQETLGISKSADGVLALKWWKQGRIDQILKYCKQDVSITKELYLYGKKNNYLVFKNKAKHRVRVPVFW